MNFMNFKKISNISTMHKEYTLNFSTGNMIISFKKHPHIILKNLKYFQII